MQHQCRRLLDEKLYDSAEKLGSFLLSASKNGNEPVFGAGSHAESLSIYADALYGKEEYRRALHYYKQATQRRKVGPHMAPSSSASSSSSFLSSSSPSAQQQHQQHQQSSASPSFGAQHQHQLSFDHSLGSVAGLSPNSNDSRGSRGSPTSPPYASVAGPEEAELKYKECLCLHKLEETPKAISTLEAVPPSLRTLPMNLLLGSIYMSTGTGSRVNAIKVYKDAVRQNPLALEAIGPLVDLGVDAREILALVERSEAFSGTGSADDQLSAALGMGGVGGGVGGSWLENYVEGLVGLRRNEQSLAMQHWGALDNRFPNNLTSLLNLGMVHLSADRLDDAHFYFNKAR